MVFSLSWPKRVRASLLSCLRDHSFIHRNVQDNSLMSDGVTIVWDSNNGDLWEFNEWMNQSISWLINWCINQSINQSFNQWLNLSIDSSISNWTSPPPLRILLGRNTFLSVIPQWWSSLHQPNQRQFMHFDNCDYYYYLLFLFSLSLSLSLVILYWVSQLNASHQCQHTYAVNVTH